MVNAKKRYRQRCKRRSIDFYLHEVDLYEFSKTISFNRFVKDELKKLKERKEKGI